VSESVAEMIAAELASRNKKSCRCKDCDAVTEQWWNYCAMCGWHIASGDTPQERTQ